MTKIKLRDRHLALSFTLTFLLVGMQNFLGLQAKPPHLKLFNSISQNPKEKLIDNLPAKDPGVPGNRKKGGGEKATNSRQSMQYSLLPRQSAITELS